MRVAQRDPGRTAERPGVKVASPQPMKVMPPSKPASSSGLAPTTGEIRLQQTPAAAKQAYSESELVKHKLLTASMELATDELQRHMADQSEFTVVGVLGMQGVGKSTLMSLLAGAGWQRGDGAAGEPGELHDPPFAVQSLDTVLQAGHQTSGVDAVLTGERLLLLDTQPLLSPSVMVSLGAAPLPAEAQSAENLLELHSLRLCMLMLSVCHYVLVVHDVALDARLLRLLRCAQMLRSRLPDVSTVSALVPPAAAAAASRGGRGGGDRGGGDRGGGGGDDDAGAGAPAEPAVTEFQPQLVFVGNRMPLDAFAQHETLHAAFSRLFTDGTLGCAAASPAPAPNPAPNPAPASAPVPASASATGVATEPEDGGGGGSGGGGAGGGGGGFPEPLSFLLPARDAAGVCTQHLGYVSECERVRDELLLRCGCRAFAKPLSEREWLRGVGRVWDLVRKSTNVAEYNRTLQRLHYFQ